MDFADNHTVIAAIRSAMSDHKKINEEMLQSWLENKYDEETNPDFAEKRNKTEERCTLKAAESLLSEFKHQPAMLKKILQATKIIKEIDEGLSDSFVDP